MKIFIFFAGFALATSFCKAQKSSSSPVWTSPLDGYTCSFPCKDGDFIYVGSEACKVLCLEAATGKKVWEFFTHPEKLKSRNAGVIHTIICDANNVYFNDCGISVFALDKKTGVLKWQHKHVFKSSGAMTAFDDDIAARPVLFENTLIINTVSSMLAFDVSNGKVVWEYEVKKTLGSMSMNNGKVYGATKDSLLICLDAKTGKKVFQTKTKSATDTYQLAVTKDKVIVAGGNPKADTLTTIGCYDAKTGKLVWELSDRSSFVFAYDDAFFLANDKGLACVQAKNGKTIWKVDGVYSWYTAPCFFDNILYIHNRRVRKILGFQIADGQLVKEFPLQDKTYTVPIVTAGEIYYGEYKDYKCMSTK